MSTREQRLAELVRARQRIDTQIARMNIRVPDLPTDLPAPTASVDALADLARRLVWSGHTHAEVAHQLHIHPESVAGLIAPRRLA